MSNGDTVPHYGTQVILKPNLPPGIETKHLSLLANQALIDGNEVVLTDADATAADLSAALQARVSEIMGKEFGAITDADLLTKLTSQMTTIREQSSQADQNTVTDSLNNVDPLIEQLEEALTDGSVTPNEDLTSAFDSYKAALDTVRNSVNESTRTEAIGDLQAAHWTLATAFQEVVQQQMDTYQQSFDSAQNGIQQAQQASERMDDIEKSYENTENAASISEYENSMKQVNEATEAE
jgi:formiminotetrahydrofolate cyclodeaminase